MLRHCSLRYCCIAFFSLQKYLNQICASHPHFPPLCNLLHRRELEIESLVSGAVLHSCCMASSLGAQITPGCPTHTCIGPAAGSPCPQASCPASHGTWHMVAKGKLMFYCGLVKIWDWGGCFWQEKIAFNPVWQHKPHQRLIVSMGFALHS